MYPSCAVQNSWIVWLWCNKYIMGFNTIQGLPTIKIRLVLCNTLRKGGDETTYRFLGWNPSQQLCGTPLDMSKLELALQGCTVYLVIWWGELILEFVFCSSSFFYFGILRPRGNARSVPAFAAIANHLAWQTGEYLFLLGFAGICLKVRSLCQPADY